MSVASRDLLKMRVKSVLHPKILAHYALELKKATHINRALRKCPGIYVEIGVRRGDCIKEIKAERKIAVDPQPDIGSETLRKENIDLYAVPSDIFFKDHAPRLFEKNRIAVALVDGLHEFRQSLRDIINLSPYMTGGG